MAAKRSKAVRGQPSVDADLRASTRSDNPEQRQKGLGHADGAQNGMRRRLAVEDREQRRDSTRVRVS
jgi:hypothetical protein